MEEKSNKNQCAEVQKLMGKSELEKFTDLIADKQISHNRSSWRHLDNKEKFDTSMCEKTLGKRKFNQEKPADIESHPIIEGIAKRVKSNNGYVEGRKILEPEWSFSKDNSELTETISVVAKWQADQNQ
ncbi:hypothetical protein J1N35_007847 [Gossypium stocksii]|uniref:Uncharacterized protein n=1 Tax=Gossypium stocksii TaxID=47602 RepID=A0A9D3W756_9ROSI|nr:hypothetical protein J1N35_007847 [Gossypium stocksii]